MSTDVVNGGPAVFSFERLVVRGHDFAICQILGVPSFVVRWIDHGFLTRSGRILPYSPGDDPIYFNSVEDAELALAAWALTGGE